MQSLVMTTFFLLLQASFDAPLHGSKPVDSKYAAGQEERRI